MEKKGSVVFRPVKRPPRQFQIIKIWELATYVNKSKPNI